MSRSTPTPPAASGYDVDAVRGQFPILLKPHPNGNPLVYVDNGATAQKPRCVIDKMVEVMQCCYANVHRAGHSLGGMVTAELESARGKIRALLNARSSDEVIFTAGTTASLNTVAAGWGRKFVSAGDVILLNEMEHHANLVPWQQLAADRGAVLRFIPLTPDGRLDLEQLPGLLTSRTKLVSITAMSNVLGTVNPVREIADAAHRVGAVVVVDGAQSTPHSHTDVQSLGADFYAFSGHKLYGPTGIGVLYGRSELLEAMDPFLGGGNMIRRVFRDRFEPASLPAKFEAGTPPIAEAIALGTAVDFVTQLGFDAIAAHEQALLVRAYERLSAVRGLKILGPPPAHRGAIISFTIDRMHAKDVSDLLDLRGVVVREGHHCAMPLHDWAGIPASTRISFGMYNTLEEVDVCVDAVLIAKRLCGLK
jgi:cysteine desulfurase/selenocysteine lyase